MSARRRLERIERTCGELLARAPGQVDGAGAEIMRRHVSPEVAAALESEAAKLRSTGPRRWAEMAEIVRRHVSPEQLAAMADDLAAGRGLPR